MKTYKSCVLYLMFYFALCFIVPTILILIEFLVTPDSVVIGLFSLLSLILGIIFSIYGASRFNLKKYNNKNHQIVCFEAFNSFLIIDNKIVDKAERSLFHPPVLSYKSKNDIFEYSHKRLKINGQYINK